MSLLITHDVSNYLTLSQTALRNWIFVRIQKKEITILAIYKKRRRNYSYMTKSRFLLCRNLQFLGDNVSHYPTQDKMKLTNTHWLPTNSDYLLEQESQYHLLVWCQINKIRLQGIKWIMGEVLPKKVKMEEKIHQKDISLFIPEATWERVHLWKLNHVS